MKHLNILFQSCIFLALASCDADELIIPSGGSSNTAPDNEWLIPIDEVLDGGPGKDGIPALELPEKWDLSDSDNSYLDDDDLVLAYFSDGEICAYPHPVLDWHEIINDRVGEDDIAISYCPLTGTGMAWDRLINNELSTFGVSGLLYNSNLILYDRATGSNWSQIRLDCVNGSLIGKEAKIRQVVEMPWSTWKEMYPASKVVGTETGYNRSYGFYPYRDYKTSSQLYFNAKPSDSRLHKKERVLGVLIDEKVKVYRFESFGDNLSIIMDSFMNTDFIVAGKNNDFMVAYEPLTESGIQLQLTPHISSAGGIMKDQEGNIWNVFGYAISGPRTGEKLKKVEFFMGYWFSFAAFYPIPDIYQ